MRKHKLQENLHKKNGNDATVADPRPCKVDPKPDSEMAVRDESCQTDEYFDHAGCFRSGGSFRRKCRKRDSVRYFRKCNSYCQYKSLSMFHKKMCNRQTEAQSFGSFETLDTGPPEKPKDELPVITAKTEEVADKLTDLKSEEEDPKPAHKVNNLQKSHSEKTISPLRRLSPIVRQYSYPPLLRPLEDDKNLLDLSLKPKIIFSESDGIKNVEVFSFAHRPQKAFAKSAKSLDQNTSGYNTVNGSLDETPRRKAPEMPKFENTGAKEEPRKGENGSTPENERKSSDSFPITFHSESVFLHPYENGFLSHKELHHISIQRVSEGSIRNDTNLPQDYHKTEIKLNVTPAGDTTARETCRETQDIKTVPRAAPAKTETLDSKVSQTTTEGKTPTRDEIRTSPGEGSGHDDTNSTRGDDCTGSTSSHPIKTEQSKLKIELDVMGVDLSKSLQELLVRDRRLSAERKVKPPTREPRSQSEKYNSKTALNYLFQKLGDTYPKRGLLKQPSFQEDYPRYPPYYPDLPRIEYPPIPPKVLFNNQTYDILSEKLLPSELPATGSKRWDGSTDPFPNLSQVRKLSEDRDDRLSDSDTSIPDSLEEFQQTKSKYKRDERAALGEAQRSKRVKFSKPRGSISYFVPLDELNVRQNNVMPAKLVEKLRARGRNISKHSVCIESKKRGPKSAKLVHKQIQTSFNSENGSKKGRSLKTGSKDSDLDERIMNILLTGLRIQEAVEREAVENVAKSLRNNAEVEKRRFKEVSSRSVQTERSEQEEGPLMSEFEEILKVSSPINDVVPDTSIRGTDGHRESHDTAIRDTNGHQESQDSQFYAHSEGPSENLYEVIQSEEEVAKIDSTNYYRSIKKSRRVYYPIKFENQRFSRDSRNHHDAPVSPQNAPSFSKYQKNLREFKEQMRKQNSSKIHAPNFGELGQDSRANNSALMPYQNFKMKKLKEKHKFKNVISKITGSRSRFRQKFEAIPEETLSNSSEIDQNRDLSHQSRAEEQSRPIRSPSEKSQPMRNRVEDDENSNERTNDGDDHDRTETLIEENFNENQIIEVSAIRENNEDDNLQNCKVEDNLQNRKVEDNFQNCVQENEEYKGKMKSQKGRDSLSSVNEQEELITLSRGWINFYLLNGNNTEENIGTNEENESNYAIFWITKYLKFYSKFKILYNWRQPQVKQPD